MHPSRVALLDAIAEVAVDAILRQAEAYGDQLPVPLVVEEVVADKGYHAAATLAACAAVGLRTYIPERECGRRRWQDKPVAWAVAVRGNRRLLTREWGRRSPLL